MFVAARATVTPTAQFEFWLEYQWLDQEYRHAVLRLRAYCAHFDPQVQAYAGLAANR